MGLINPSLRSGLACEAPTSRMQNFCANPELALNSNRIFHSSPFDSLGALSCHGGVEGHDCTHPLGTRYMGGTSQLPAEYHRVSLVNATWCRTAYPSPASTPAHRL